MSSLNRVMLIGRVGVDPDRRDLANDQGTVVHFSLATTEKWNDREGERQERTEWHSLVAWGKRAEICDQYVHKGDLLYVAGRLQYREYDDKEGQKRQRTEIVIDELKMLGGRREGQAAEIEEAPTETGTKEPPAKKASRRRKAVA